MMSIDHAISQAAVFAAGNSVFLRVLTLFFANWSGYALLGAVLLLILYNLVRSKISPKTPFIVLLQVAAAAFLSRGIITEIIRFFWHRERPFGVSASFPSGHASFYFAIAAVLYMYNKKLGIFAFLVSIAMGIARVFAGYHWPSDIVGGTLIGIGSGFLVVKLFKKIYAQKS